MTLRRHADTKDYDGHDWYMLIIDLINDKKIDELREVLNNSTYIVDWFAGYSYPRPLTVAVQSGNLEIVKMLMEEFGYDDDSMFEPKVLETAIKSNRNNIVDYLIDERCRNLNDAAWIAASYTGDTGRGFPMLQYLIQKEPTNIDQLCELMKRNYFDQRFGKNIWCYLNQLK